jgi:hypothetical protein
MPRHVIARALDFLQHRLGHLRLAVDQRPDRQFHPRFQAAKAVRGGGELRTGFVLAPGRGIGLAQQDADLFGAKARLFLRQRFQQGDGADGVAAGEARAGGAQAQFGVAANGPCRQASYCSAASAAWPVSSKAFARRIWLCAVGVRSKARRASRTSRPGSRLFCSARPARAAEWSRREEGRNTATK